jgi:hypothetical protein
MIHSRKLVMLALVCVAAANGCASMNHTETDALAGGGLGAAAGALLDRHHPERGAAVGGIVGAATGAAVGSHEDAADRRAKAIADAQQPVRGPLTLEQVADLCHRGIGDDVIKGQIRSSGTRYNLSAEQVTWLHDQGVSDAVINEMQQTAYRRRVVYGPPPYEPVYVVPPPRPIVYGPTVGVGFGYYR